MNTTLNQTVLNQVDICFVIDTTGSMSSFIQAAKQHLLNMIGTLAATNGLDWQFGLVEYRDHPPQETSFVKRVYPLTKDVKKMQASINALAAAGGGDAPEAVYDGLEAGCKEMLWRQHSCRLMFLVGDAPPHGYQIEKKNEFGSYIPVKNSGDTWPDGCPCGLTTKKISALAEEMRIVVYAISMTKCEFTLGAFSEIAHGTGGYSSESKKIDDVLNQINSLLDAEFQNTLFDKMVLGLVEKLGTLDVQELSDQMASTRLQIVSALTRLARRNLLPKEPKQIKKNEITPIAHRELESREPIFLLTSLLNSFFPWGRR